MDRMILDLRHLVGENEDKAAQLHVKCLSYIDETDKVLNLRVPSYHSRSTSPCRINPVYGSVSCYIDHRLVVERRGRKWIHEICVIITIKVDKVKIF